MRSGALDGLSIGFKAVRTRRDPTNGIRRILEADLWEISVVTFPMLPGARIETVKGRSSRPLPSAKEFETWLRLDAGFSKGEAHTVVTRGFSSLLSARNSASGPIRDLAERIRAASHIINKRGKSI